MPVQLNSDNEPEVWGDEVVGREIPNPPDVTDDEVAVWSDASASWTVETRDDGGTA